ncbi:DAZ protein 1 [Aphelenchoides avenae]|nr:DAZ protein 1 [Aphelenchus avenae]
MQSFEGFQGQVGYPSVAPASPYFAAVPAYEHIPHRIFVGGFSSTTTEADLRLFFEQFCHIRDAKVIRSPDGSSKGYGFVTLDSEEEANAIRSMPAERFEFKGRRLNLGPAIRRVGGFRMAPGAQYWPAPSPTFNYQFAYPQVPPYMMFAPPNTPLSAVPSLYSPQTSPVASPMGSNEGGNNCSPANSMETPSPASSGTPTPLADLWIQQNQGGMEMPNQEMNTNVTYAPPTPFMQYPNGAPMFWPPQPFGVPEMQQAVHHQQPQFAVPNGFVPQHQPPMHYAESTFFPDNNGQQESKEDAL